MAFDELIQKLAYEKVELDLVKEVRMEKIEKMENI